MEGSAVQVTQPSATLAPTSTLERSEGVRVARGCGSGPRECERRAITCKAKFNSRTMTSPLTWLAPPMQCSPSPSLSPSPSSPRQEGQSTAWRFFDGEPLPTFLEHAWRERAIYARCWRSLLTLADARSFSSGRRWQSGAACCPSQTRCSRHQGRHHQRCGCRRSGGGEQCQRCRRGTRSCLRQ